MQINELIIFLLNNQLIKWMTNHNNQKFRSILPKIMMKNNYFHPPGIERS